MHLGAPHSYRELLQRISTLLHYAPAPASTPSPTATLPASDRFVRSSSLSSGSYGPEVGQLQKKLQSLGFYSGSINQYYDTTTYFAVAHFQWTHGLPGTGTVDAATALALASANTGTTHTPSQTTSQPPSQPPSQAPSQPQRLSDPNSFFFSQFYHPRWNPQGPQSSTNCGPASLAMALRAFGILPPGASDPNNVEQLIDKTRRAMMGHEDDQTLSSDDEVLRGAVAAGAQAHKVNGLSEVEGALAEGKLVVLAGNPEAYGPRFGSDYSQFNGGHFILVTGMDGDRVTINDPLSRVGSMTITRNELKAYMAHQGWNVGVALWA